MNHNSANLAFGRREKKYLGVQKAPGGKKPIRKSEKKVATFFFFFFFLETKNFVGGGKNEQGAPNGNVTPLYQYCYNLINVTVVKNKIVLY